MNDALFSEIQHRLAGLPVTPNVAKYVLAAYISPETLIDGQADQRDSGPEPRPSVAAVSARVFLESVVVEGFRGIGPALSLKLAPGPGLTLIVGRNGTGKSSLSDALEVLLTGNSARWAAKKSKTWQEGWRNLHHPDPTTIEARLVVEGQAGFTGVARRWTAGADLAAGTVTVTRPGQRSASFDSLGWREALYAYRPFLSYSELGGLLEDGPSKLFDALNAILGLDDLTVAVKALADARLEIERRAKQTVAELFRLRQLLESSADERAARLLAVTAKVPDLEKVAALIGPSLIAQPEGGQVEVLRRLASLDLPSSEDVTAVANRLSTAAEAVDMAAATDAGRARGVAGLLDAAVEFHLNHGDGDCPVCGRPQALSATWRSEADTERARLRAEARDADQAHEELAEAVAAARSLLRAPPAALSTAGSVGIDASTALAGWQTWAAGPADDTAAGLGYPPAGDREVARRRAHRPGRSRATPGRRGGRVAAHRPGRYRLARPRPGRPDRRRHGEGPEGGRGMAQEDR